MKKVYKYIFAVIFLFITSIMIVTSMPVRIRNVHDFLNMDGWKNYKLVADLDFSDTYPLTDFNISLRGNFNGNDHTISNLTINYTGANSENAMFGQNIAEIYDLKFENILINVDENNTNGDDLTAGVVGRNFGIIRNVHFSGTIISNDNSIDYAGGLVGWNNTTGVIENCISDVVIESYASNDDIVRYVGGITGINQGIINLTSSKFDISTNNIVGGIVGYNSTFMGGDPLISNTLSYGSIHSTNVIGGIVGYMQGGQISNVVSNVDIEYSNQEVSIGFIVGRETGETIDYSDIYLLVSATIYEDVDGNKINHDDNGLVMYTLLNEVAYNYDFLKNTIGFKDKNYILDVNGGIIILENLKN